LEEFEQIQDNGDILDIFIAQFDFEIVANRTMSPQDTPSPDLAVVPLLSILAFLNIPENSFKKLVFARLQAWKHVHHEKLFDFAVDHRQPRITFEKNCARHQQTQRKLPK
jgi:hypothetical protein